MDIKRFNDKRNKITLMIQFHESIYDVGLIIN